MNRPRLVILDEATSAFDLVTESKMYSLLQTMAASAAADDARPALTYVSVGHRPSLLAFHDRRLRLGGEEAHELTDISTTDAESSGVVIPKNVSNL